MGTRWRDPARRLLHDVRNVFDRDRELGHILGILLVIALLLLPLDRLPLKLAAVLLKSLLQGVGGWA